MKLFETHTDNFDSYLILDSISHIESSKAKKNIEPPYATLRELSIKTKLKESTIHEIAQHLRDEGRIVIRRTINSYSYHKTDA